MSIWTAVDQLIDQSTDEEGLVAHGLDLWAAHRWHAASRDVPADFLLHERAAAMATLSVEPQLAWIRKILDGPIILLKGPEVAARYPDPAHRPFGDLDLLVPDADRAQAKLLAAGCSEVTEERPHHRPALRCPGWLLLIEIHERPNGPKWSRISALDLWDIAVPSSLPVEGIMTVPPTYQAILLAAHSWHHEPLRRLTDLIDIAAMSEGQDPIELQALATKWGLGRVWNTTRCAIEAVIRGTPPKSPFCRLMGAHLWRARQRTRREIRAASLVAAFWAPLTPVGSREMLSGILILFGAVAKFAGRNIKAILIEPSQAASRAIN